MAPGAGEVDGIVDVTEYLGADTYLIVDTGAPEKITVRAPGGIDVTAGAEVGLGFHPDRRHFFDGGGAALR
ncbi:MAG: TOBE domain-containing protein [Pseudomonadota bacterium]